MKLYCLSNIDALKFNFSIFQGITCMLALLENCRQSISTYNYSLIQGTIPKVYYK